MESGNQNRRKKRPKSYYIKSAKQPRSDRIMEGGLKGFLITCNNNKEKNCTREAYALLNKYADSLYGPEKPETERNGDEKNDDDDIEAILKREVEEMTSLHQSVRRFQAVNSGSKNCIFIKAQIPDPCELVRVIFSDVTTKGYKQQSRFILRLLPVTCTCRSTRDDIVKAVDSLLPQYFKDTSPSGKTFAILFKSRNSNVISRTEIIPILAAKIHQLDPANKADLQSPNLAVIVDVIAKFTFISVVPNFYELRKYNLSELCSAAKSLEDHSEKCDVSETKVADGEDTARDMEKAETMDEPLAGNAEASPKDVEKPAVNVEELS